MCLSFSSSSLWFAVLELRLSKDCDNIGKSAVYVNYLINPIYSYFSAAVSFFNATLNKRYTSFASTVSLYNGRCDEATTIKADSLILAKFNIYIKMFKPDIMYKLYIYINQF